MPDFNLLTAAVQSRSRASSAQRMVNLYPEKSPDGDITLYSAPGLSLWRDVGSGPIRGMKKAGGTLYVVSGRNVYAVTSTEALLLGAIGTESGIVSMASNGTQIQLLDGSATGYIITIAGNIFSPITDGDFPGGVTNAFIDGFIIFNEPNSGRIWQTEGYAAESIDPLKFAVSEGLPDNVVSVLADHRELWVFNEDSTEIFYNAGAAGFALERIQGAFIEHGCAAAYSPQKMDNTVFWLGKDEKGQGMVWRADGYTPRRVSTHEIEYTINSFDRIDDAVAWSYQQDGHAFYVLNFPSADATLVYDAATDHWHERGWFNAGRLHRHRGQVHCYFDGQHLVGDWERGRIYTMSMDAFDDAGDEICRELITTHFRTGKRAFYGELEIRMETGAGRIAGQGSDPVVMLSTSNDQGQTFGSWRTSSMGKRGKHLERVTFSRNGSGHSMTFRIRVTDPVKVVITGASVEVSA